MPVDLESLMKQKGFTLIELLTVVLIIAVLTAVAVPQYRRVMQRSYVAEAQTLLRAIYDSSERLAGEFGAVSYPMLYEESVAEGNDHARVKRMDMFDTTKSTFNFRCQLDSDGYGITCTRWHYRLDEDDKPRYIVATKIGNPYEGAKVVFDRDAGDVFCINDLTERACDVYNIDEGEME